jgi:peptidoglycan/xylan/chitin deacetylase (PgdA/CDA1 family)
MPTFSKKQRLAAWLNRCGLFRLLEWWGRRPGLVILAYHRIGSPAGHLLDDGVLSATPEDFEVQLDYLRRHFDLPSLETVLDAVETGLPLSGPTALITFDDGYQDNVDCALPILHKRGIQAVFFICPRFVTSRQLPFWDRLAFVFKKAARSFNLERPFAYQVDLDGVSRPTAILRYLSALGDWSGRFDEQQLFEHVEERAGVETPVESLGKNLFADWNGVRRLMTAGMSIGSHCLTHPALPLLSEDEQRHELTGSKVELEQQLGRAITTVAYPYGQHNDLTRRLAREAGYRLGFSYPGGRIYRTLTDLFDVRRIPIDCDVIWPEFRARLACSGALGRSVF